MKVFLLPTDLKKKTCGSLLPLVFGLFCLLAVWPDLSALAVPLPDKSGASAQDALLAPNPTAEMRADSSPLANQAGAPLAVDERDLDIDKVGDVRDQRYLMETERDLSRSGEGVVSFKYDQMQSSAFVLSPDSIRELGQERWEEAQISRINFTIFWIVSLGVFGLAALFLFSRHTFALIVKNCRRLDETLSANRTSGETRYLLALFCWLVFYVALFGGMLGGAVWLLDSLVIPLEFLSRIFSVFNLNPIAWEFAIRERVFNDVGALYEAWCQMRGYSSGTYTFLLELLWRNGFLLLGMTLLTLSIVSVAGYFLCRRIVFRLNRFQQAAEKRRFRYDRYDRKQVFREAQ